MRALVMRACNYDAWVHACVRECVRGYLNGACMHVCVRGVCVRVACVPA
jgi:hypothetical protein